MLQHNESYLDVVPRKLRIYLTKLRASVLPVRIQTGRYNRNKLLREERRCLFCNQVDIEDEFHFVCVCTCFTEIRKKYIKKCNIIHPSVFKYCNMLQSSNTHLLSNLAKYVKEAIIYRTSILNNIV